MTGKIFRAVDTTRIASRLAGDLADRLELGANALAELAGGLSESEWRTRIAHDGRTIGVVVHHVAIVYPLEIQLAQLLAQGTAVKVTWDDVHAANARHAGEYSDVTRDEALELLRRNSTAAAEAIRDLSDDELAQAAPVAMYGNAPLTCQFMLEDHAVRHSYHHVARIIAALKR
jgi:hypothetical protein